MQNKITRASFFLKKYEPWIFGILVLLNATPLLSSHYFVTVDGPSHLYNASILKNLLFGNDLAIHNFYSINHEPVPNWTAHFLLSLFNFIGPSWFAEKLFLLVYVIGLPYAFRFMLRSVNSNMIFLSLLILPFTYTFLLMMGFFNFAIAFLPLFIMLGIYFKNTGGLTWKKSLLLFMWAGLLYFSHIYIFTAGILVIALHASTLLFQTPENKRRDALKSFSKIFFALIPFFALFVLFLYNHHKTIPSPDISFAERLSMLKQMRCLSMFSIEDTSTFTGIIGVALLFFLLAAVVFWIRNSANKTSNRMKTPAWLFAGIFFFILFLLLPDEIGGGMNCFRMLQLFAICIVAWIALNPPPFFLSLPLLILILVMQGNLIAYYKSTNSVLSKEADEWAEAGKIPEKNSFTLPIMFNKTWLNYHFSGYFGAVNSRMIAHNYEAGLNWFPVVFSKSGDIKIDGQETNNPLIDFSSYIQNTSFTEKIADYVVVWQYPHNVNDSIAFHPIDSLLKCNYSLSYHSENIRLFRKNKL